MIRAVELLIHGRVQGVYCRGWNEAEASALGLRGWARNNPDGTVSACLVGPVETVQQMIDACHDGPRDARVERIEQREIQPVPPSQSFSILR